MPSRCLNHQKHYLEVKIRNFLLRSHGLAGSSRKKLQIQLSISVHFPLMALFSSFFDFNRTDFLMWYSVDQVSLFIRQHLALIGQMACKGESRMYDALQPTKKNLTTFRGNVSEETTCRLLHT
jgi:hypothetical protein